jgi:HTH-type transcriptional regulator/antitoxin MqsA
MFECNVCGSERTRKQHTSQVFEINGRCVLVENIPALVCERCDDASFDIEVGERIRTMIHGASKPNRSIAVDVFEYA